MGDSRPDETRVLPKKTLKRSSFCTVVPNPARPMRYLISRRRLAKESSSIAVAEEMETLDKPTSHPPATSYGYLEHIQSLKPKLTPEDKSLPKKVRKYYQDQLELITSIEDILVQKDDATADRKGHKTNY